MGSPAPSETSSTRRHRVFTQARAEATYRALLAASREVFASKGFDRAQSPDIAAAAGVSVGTFYRYFTDKRQAFVEMIGHHLAEAHAEVLGQLSPERFRGSERREAIDMAVEVLFRHVARFPDLEGVYQAMSLRDPDVARLKAEFDALGRDALTALIQLLIPPEVVPDPRAAAFVIHHAALEIAVARTIRREGKKISKRAIQHALGEMLERYLFPVSR